jgi:hypothetical protein
MPRKRERQIQKEKDKGIIEMAAEQFAILLWRQLLHSIRINKLRSKSLRLLTHAKRFSKESN